MKKKELIKDNHPLIREIESLIDGYVVEISRQAEIEKYRPLIHRPRLRAIFQAAYYGPKNAPLKGIEEAAGLPQGTITRWMDNARLKSCRMFSKAFWKLKGDKDTRINKTLTKEAIQNPKFGLDYQKATQPNEFGKQIIETNKNETLRITLTDIRKIQLEIKSLDDELRSIGLDPTRCLAASPEEVSVDAEIVPDNEGEFASSLPAPGETSVVSSSGS
mgnify:FL=1